jgi:dihydrofolate reductase
MNVPVTIIAAIGKNFVIGCEGQIPWHLPTDFAHFKRTTLGKPLIMGRKTYTSIGRPLPGRANIVVTRQADYAPQGVLVCHSLAEALERAQSIAVDDDANEVMVAGGAEIYREAMPLVDRLCITHVATSPAGDAVFPSIDPDRWEITQRHDIQRGERDSADFSVLTYRRRGLSAR